MFGFEHYISIKTDVSNMKQSIILLLTFGVFHGVFADSPLTSTEFYSAYMNVPLVQEASKSKGRMSEEMLAYIENDQYPLDIKLAIINALGWNQEGKDNSKLFLKSVINKKRYHAEIGGDFIAFKWHASRDELICYAYLKAFEGNCSLDDAYAIASEAIRKHPTYFSVNMIYHLIKAQGLSNVGEYCYASKLFISIKAIPNIKLDMRKEAMKDIFTYMNEIGNNCK